MDNSNTSVSQSLLQDPRPSQAQAERTTEPEVVLQDSRRNTSANGTLELEPLPIPIVTEQQHRRSVSVSESRSGSSPPLETNKRDTKFSLYSDQPLPPLPEDISPLPNVHPDPRSIPLNTRRISLLSGQQDPPRRKTAGERLDPTLLTAIAEKEKYAFKAKLTGFALNAAIGMQVLLGALTTGLSVVTTGHQTQVMTAVLGGISTIVASYLARARGSNEPELSIARVKDLEQFIRECEAFKMDRGHVVDDTEDEKLLEFRRRFEDLLGNASGERKLSA